MHLCMRMQVISFRFVGYTLEFLGFDRFSHLPLQIMHKIAHTSRFHVICPGTRERDTSWVMRLWMSLKQISRADTKGKSVTFTDNLFATTLDVGCLFSYIHTPCNVLLKQIRLQCYILNVHEFIAPLVAFAFIFTQHEINIQYYSLGIYFSAHEIEPKSPFCAGGDSYSLAVGDTDIVF